MFNVVLFTAIGIAVGYLLRRVKVLRQVNSTISLTICFMLFVLGLSVGENRSIVQNLWRYGGQGLFIGIMAVLGSAVAGWAVYRFVFKQKEEAE